MIEQLLSDRKWYKFLTYWFKEQMDDIHSYTWLSQRKRLAIVLETQGLRTRDLSQGLQTRDSQELERNLVAEEISPKTIATMLCYKINVAIPDKNPNANYALGQLSKLTGCDPGPIYAMKLNLMKQLINKANVHYILDQVDEELQTSLKHWIGSTTYANMLLYCCYRLGCFLRGKEQTSTWEQITMEPWYYLLYEHL